MVTKNQLKTIREFFKTEPVEMVYLFGSQATGENHLRSDYDFGVVFADTLDKGERFDKRFQYMAEIGSIVGTDTVDVIDLNSAPVYFQYSAIAPRQDIYVEHERYRVDFEKQTLSFYFDRLPYLKRHTFESLATIASEGL